MTRSLIITLFVLGFNINGIAQAERWSAGFGLTYCSCVDRPGVNLNISYRVKGNFFIGPDFSALLEKRIHRYTRLLVHTEVEYNLNAHQLIEIIKGVEVYPLAGINLSKITFKSGNEEPMTQWVKAINTGLGAEAHVGKAKLFTEGKYVTRIKKFDFTIGVLFPI
jgi:hypothetical protein